MKRVLALLLGALMIFGTALPVFASDCDTLGHSWGDGEVQLEATCTKQGIKIYTCSRCGATKKVDIPANGHNKTNLITKAATCTDAGAESYTCNVCGQQIIEPINPLGHDYIVKVIEPTCIDGGVTKTTCSRCDYEEFSDQTSPLGHDWGEGTVTTEPTCTEKGKKTYTCSRCSEPLFEDVEALGHDYVAEVIDPTCTDGGYTKTTCSRCDYEAVSDETEALGHDYITEVIEPTCTTGGYTKTTCSRCDYEAVSDEKAALDHDWDEGVITTEPKCEEKGVKTFHCSRCEETKTEDVAALDHDWDEGAVTTAPTCIQKGEKTFHCSRCVKTKTEEIEIDPNAHEWNGGTVVNPTCTEQGYTKYICALDTTHTFQDHFVPALGHDWDEGEITLKPTCTEKGEITYTCNRDPAHPHKKAIEVDANGHAWVETVIEPTCETAGKTILKCSVCQKEEVKPGSEVDPIAGDHAWKTVETFAPTCTEAGYTKQICEKCGAEQKIDEKSATGHAFYEGDARLQKWVVTKEATVDEEGEEALMCQKCGEHGITRTIPKLEPIVKIRNYVPVKTVDFRTSIVFTADVENPIKGGEIHWYQKIRNRTWEQVKEIGTGTTCTVEEPTVDYVIYAKYVVNGKDRGETDQEAVYVKNNLWARIVWFFGRLFGGKKGPVIQEVVDFVAAPRILP